MAASQVAKSEEGWGCEIDAAPLGGSAARGREQLPLADELVKILTTGLEYVGV